MNKVTIEIEECIGCGSCAALCDKSFEIDDNDMKAHLRGAEAKPIEEIEISDADIESNIEAAESCPVNCIHVYVSDEKKI